MILIDSYKNKIEEFIKKMNITINQMFEIISSKIQYFVYFRQLYYNNPFNFIEFVKT